MLTPALWKLVRLQWNGRFRQFVRSLKTIRGLVMLAFILLMTAQFCFTLWLKYSVRAFNHLQSSNEDLVAIGIFLFTCYSVLLSTGDGVVLFTPSEMAFLFPAPITRSQLFAYKLFQNMVGIAGISLMFIVLWGAPFELILLRYCGFFLTIFFISLMTLNVALIRHIIRLSVVRSVRIAIGAVVVVLLVRIAIHLMSLGPFTDLPSVTNALQKTPTAVMMLRPFRFIGTTVSGANLSEVVTALIGLLMIDLGLLALAFRLDASCQDVILTISEKGAERIKRIQQKGVWHMPIKVDSRTVRRRIPMPPFCRGIGPIIWQRMMTIVRSSKGTLQLLLVVMFFAGMVVYMIPRANPKGEVAAFVGLGIMAYMTFLISLVLPNDIDRVGFLKSLPISSTSIVIGDLIGMPILVAVAQSLFILGEACYFTNASVWLISSIILTLPLNFLIFGVDKLVFYVYPTRMVKGAPGDLQGSGKQMIFGMIKMLMLGTAALVAATAIVPVAIFIRSPIAIFATAEFILIVECIALIPLLTLAFNAFDPSTTQVS